MVQHPVMVGEHAGMGRDIGQEETARSQILPCRQDKGFGRWQVFQDIHGHNQVESVLLDQDGFVQIGHDMLKAAFLQIPQGRRRGIDSHRPFGSEGSAEGLEEIPGAATQIQQAGIGEAVGSQQGLCDGQTCLYLFLAKKRPPTGTPKRRNISEP